MGLETVIKDIIDAAQEEVKIINFDADTEVSQILDEAKHKAKTIIGERMAKVEDEIKRLERREISSANLEVKRAMLNARKEVLETVYRQTIDKLQALSEEKQEELLKTIIETNKLDNGKIYSNKESEDMVRKLSTLEYAGNIDCIGGVIMENEDGTIRLDYRYDIILKRVNEQSLKQTSDILFG